MTIKRHMKHGHNIQNEEKTNKTTEKAKKKRNTDPIEYIGGKPKYT